MFVEKYRMSAGKNRKCLRAAKVENKVSACTAKRKALLFTHVKTTDPHGRVPTEKTVQNTTSVALDVFMLVKVHIQYLKATKA